MKPWIVLIAALAFAHGQRIITIQRIPLISAGQPVNTPPKPSCEEQCANTYSSDTHEKSSGLKSCETGCRFLSLIETVDSSPFLDKSGSNEKLKNCEKSCEASFQVAGDREACNSGCSLQLPIAQGRRQTINSVLENFFGHGGFPKIQIGSPTSNQEENHNGLSSMFNSMPNFDEMFSTMRSHMNDMMSRFMNNKDGEGEMIPKEGTGRMVVIKSGPGYHQERITDFGPDGVKTQVKSNGKPIENDMMSQMNPIERFFKNDLVDVFNPKPKVETKEAEETVDEFERAESKPIFEVDVNPDTDEFSTVHGFDYDGPRLPEEGLRTRFFYPRHMQHICAQKSENMKWSDWVSCLHMRMGLPRWLTAATISLGIVFIIWLCLVIPQNAPKQKVKMTKAMEAAGKLEKDRLNIIMANPVKLDLPPSYEDIANLHVAVPIVNDCEAGPIPEKKKPDDGEA